MFERFFSPKPKASLDSVTFDSSRYNRGEEFDDCRTWFTPEGDGLGLFRFLKEPDLPKHVNSAKELREFYLSRYSGHELRVVEVDLMFIDGVRSVWSVFKVPQQPHGLTYLASITIPFSSLSFVLKMQCQEHGPTGLREAAIFMKAQEEGRVTISPDSDIVGDWNPDDAAYDDQFPEHPVSRARREFARLRSTLRIADQVRKQKPFYDKT